MKAHLIDTHLLVPRSRSSAKVKVKYRDHVSQKMDILGALVFHKHIFFFFFFNPLPRLSILGSSSLAANKDMMAKICTKWGYSYLLEKKVLWEKEKLLVTSNFSFNHSVFKSSLLVIC